MPATLANALLKRQYSTDSCPSGYSDDGDGYCVDPWYSYGRWVLVGAVIVGAFLLFCCFSCITARRRRRMGQRPLMGTGWAGGPPAYGQQGGYASQNYYNAGNAGATQGYGQTAPQGWQAPPPQYARDVANDGHYGKPQPQTELNTGYGQQSGSVELQSPGHSYQPHMAGGDNVYQPPPGPPPGKGDGIVR